jgi:hypothetical protein
MDIAYSVPGLPDAIRNRSTPDEGLSFLSLQSSVAMLTRQLSYASFALLVWDMLLMLKDEVRWPYLTRFLKLPQLHQRFTLSGQHVGLLSRGCS